MTSVGRLNSWGSWKLHRHPDARSSSTEELHAFIYGHPWCVETLLRSSQVDLLGELGHVKDGREIVLGNIVRREPDACFEERVGPPRLTLLDMARPNLALTRGEPKERDLHARSKNIDAVYSRRAGPDFPLSDLTFAVTAEVRELLLGESEKLASLPDSRADPFSHFFFGRPLTAFNQDPILLSMISIR